MAQKSVGRLISIVIVIAIVGVLLAFTGSLFETVKAGEYHIKQAAVSGKLSCHTNPGMYPQLFGDVYRYYRADSYNFEGRNAISVRFNDGAKAEIEGSITVTLPTNCEKLKLIHETFRSHQRMMDDLIRNEVQKALYATGPFMSSAESYASRRSEFIRLSNDQLKDGLFQTETKKERIIIPENVPTVPGSDPSVVTPVKSTTREVQRETTIIRKDPKSGAELRVADGSRMRKYGIFVDNFKIQTFKYSAAVIGQIEQQRKAWMEVKTARAKTEMAQEQAKKIAAEGERDALQAKWEEKKKTERQIIQMEAQARMQVLEAEAHKNVQKEKLEAVKLESEAILRKAKADSEAAQLRIRADNALELKLRTMQSIHKLWADAYAKQRPTPDIVMGGNSTDGKGGGVSAQDFMGLLTAKTARDLKLSLDVK